MDEKEYKKWLNEESSGMTVCRTVGRVEFILKLIPDEWYGYNECIKFSWTSHEFDSLCKVEKDNIRFEFEIRPATLASGQSNDIMFSNISSYDEYAQRFYSMNFDLASKISLTMKGQTIEPVFALFENTYGLTPGRKATVLFHPYSSDWKNKESIVVNFDDDIFDSGTLHFVFSHESIQNIPELQPKVFKR